MFQINVLDRLGCRRKNRKSWYGWNTKKGQLNQFLFKLHISKEDVALSTYLLGYHSTWSCEVAQWFILGSGHGETLLGRCQASCDWMQQLGWIQYQVSTLSTITCQLIVNGKL